MRGQVKVQGSRLLEYDKGEDEAGPFKMIIVFDHEEQLYRYETWAKQPIGLVSDVLQDGKPNGQRKMQTLNKLMITKMIRTPWNTIDWYQYGDELAGSVRFTGAKGPIQNERYLYPFDVRSAGFLSESSLTQDHKIEETFHNFFFKQSELVSSVTELDNGLTQIEWNLNGLKRRMKIRTERGNTIESMEMSDPQKPGSVNPLFLSTAKWVKINDEYVPEKITVEHHYSTKRNDREFRTIGYQLNFEWVSVNKRLPSHLFNHMTFADVPDGTLIKDMRRPRNFTTIGFFYRDNSRYPTLFDFSKETEAP